MITTDGWQLLYRHPAEFVPKPNVEFQHGGRVYVDGRRTLVDGIAWMCVPGAEAPGCSECVDTIGGYPFVITSTYQRGLYHVAATRLHGGVADKRGIHLSSPDSADQDLLFAILRTIEECSRISTRGALFFGGHELRPPFVLTCPEGRLAVNGYWMPDLIPSDGRGPKPNAELEARTAIAARIAAMRDSLLAHGLAWADVQQRMKAAALASPFVISVQVAPPEDRLALFRISWAFGYTTTILFRNSGSRPIPGGTSRSFEEDWQFWSSRLEYLKRLLDQDKVVFLLGGGCEFAVEAADAAGALDAARRLAEGKKLSGSQKALLPEDVRGQLERPLPLERAEVRED